MDRETDRDTDMDRDTDRNMDIDRDRGSRHIDLDGRRNLCRWVRYPTEIFLEGYGYPTEICSEECDD
jgi:hypothetical protein